MQIRTVAAVAAIGVVAAGALAPAVAGPKKPPIKQAYALELLPVPDPPSGTSCLRSELEGISMDTKKIKPTGAGILSVKVNGFSGDWDITIKDSAGEEMAVGAGTSTGGGAPATAGEDTVVMKIKKPQELQISICNFAGSPSANVAFEYKYL